MMSLNSGVFLLLACLQAVPGQVGEGPQPSSPPISWDLKFEFLDPKRIEIQLPGDSRPQVYWYMVYTVVNTGARTQYFFPTFQIVTEDLKVIDTDIGIDPLVFDAIRERYKLTHKYLVPPTRAIGDLPAGDDNARESVAIWRDFDLRSNQFKVFVAGLSGEARFVRNPEWEAAMRAAAAKPADGTDAAKPADEAASGVATPATGSGTGNTVAPAGQGSGAPAGKTPRYFTLRKTLEISYTLPGSPSARPLVQPERIGIRWIMR